MKIRKTLNKKIFTKNNVDSLIEDIILLEESFKTFIDNNVKGGELYGFIVKSKFFSICKNPIIEPLLQELQKLQNEKEEI